VTSKWATRPVLNEAVLDRLRQEMAASGIDIVSELVNMFVVDAPKMVDVLQAEADAGSWDGVRREAHGLKGSCANLGAERLAALCHDLETSAREGDVVQATQIVNGIELELTNLLSELARLPEFSPPPDA
jgi:HPt (histidine-containing phosphotransfer) domain-containing protein